MTAIDELREALRVFRDALDNLERAIDNDTRVISCREAGYMLGRTPPTISAYIAEGKLRKAWGNGIYGVFFKDVLRMMTPEQIEKYNQNR